MSIKKRLELLNKSVIARRMGVSKQAMSRWMVGRVPETRHMEFARITGIDAHLVRPDLYVLVRESHRRASR